MVVMSFTGETAKISSFSKYKDGNMTLEDLSQYEAKWRHTFTYKDLKILLCPTQQRRILFEPNNENDRAFNLTEMGHNSLKAIQITEAERRAFMTETLGDPDFVKIPVKSYWIPFTSKTE
jgi:gamma-glutamyltranspeptidase/glutathione hydrolase